MNLNLSMAPYFCSKRAIVMVFRAQVKCGYIMYQKYKEATYVELIFSQQPQILYCSVNVFVFIACGTCDGHGLGW